MRLARALLLVTLSIAGAQAHAGLFSDDEARQQVQQVGTRVSGLEETARQQAEINKQQAEASKQQADAVTQQTRSLLDIQSQLDAQGNDLRTLRGQNEELNHGLQDAEKRQKDFYIDLDSRLRHLEEIQASAPPPAPAAASAVSATPAADQGAAAGAAGAAADDPAVENRAYEAAYTLFKGEHHDAALGALRDFLKKYPESVYVPNVHYELGNIYLAQKDCKAALSSYQLLMSKYSYSPKTPDAMLGMAECQGQLGDKVAARKTLRLVAGKYAGSEAGSEAKKRLATLK